MQSWTLFWAQKSNRNKLFAGVILLVIILLVLSFFFNFIEQREGVVLDDILLNMLPHKNCSIAIFGIIWLSAIIAIWQFIKNPNILLLFLWGYIFLCLSRIITISMVKLNPPKNIVELADPITNLFYGGKFITKDLFYSGHTATVLLMYFCIEKKWVKTFLLIASILIGIMVLIQHVHYTIDVVAAPVFTYIVYRLGKMFINYPPKTN